MAWYTYTLFDAAGDEVSLGDVEDRTAWYGHGNTEEEAFVSVYGRKLRIQLNPEKKTNSKALDLRVRGRLAELKCQKTPLFTARKRYKLDPTYAVTFNLKDAFEYGRYGKNYRDFDVFFWVDWVAVKMLMGKNEYRAEPLCGVWKVSFKQLERMRKSAPIHWYNRRWKVPETNQATARKLAAFDPRLVEGATTYSIRGKGGNAACSYVLSLTNMEKVAE